MALAGLVRVGSVTVALAAARAGVGDGAGDGAGDNLCTQNTMAIITRFWGDDVAAGGGCGCVEVRAQNLLHRRSTISHLNVAHFDDTCLAVASLHI